NWCSFTESRLVTYIEACMKEKYIVNSQQPCPNGAPDCQKIMYRTALKPVYQVKQKVLKSLQWKCCPGFIGKDCEQRDPNFILVPGTETEGREEFSNHMSTSVDSREMFEVIQNHEALLDDLQSDIHQAASTLGDLQRLFENSDTSMVLEVNQSNADHQERLLQQVLFPHVENFLRTHFNPMWSSFNRSLQNLSNIVRNLSHDVEANKKSIERFQESTVPKKEFQELGTKFESKVQENIVKVDQAKRDIENQVHMQQANIHYNLSMIKADTDTKLKKLHKMQQSHFLALNNSIANMKQEQNLLENKLEALKKNLTELSSHHGPKDEAMAFMRGHQNKHDAHMSPKEETQTSSTLHEVSSQRTIIEHMEPNYEAAKDDSLDSSAYNDIMTLKHDIKHLSLAIKRHESRGDVSLCCNHTIANAIEPLNVSVETLSADLATIKQNLEEHLVTFKKLFGSNEELGASNISLDVTKIQSMLNKKGRRQQKGQDKQRDKKRPEKHRENAQMISGRNTVQTQLVEK
ncbi:MMRN2 protein, partial [Oxylabes madagascariensis]|nr:MMRN2 protein [Oxylabes madagascariensis]